MSSHSNAAAAVPINGRDVEYGYFITAPTCSILSGIVGRTWIHDHY